MRRDTVSTPQTEVAAKAPERIDKYRILGRIGHGGMAEVFLAVTSGPGDFNKLHVLKLLRQDVFDNLEGIRAFKSEARLAALLNHPNVVQTYEVGEDAGNVYMVMEYLEGANLQVILNHVRRMNLSRGFGLDLRMRVILEILNGLHYAHELRDLAGQPLNLVHRDVTPHNIFVTYDGGIKLLDFGIAKSTGASSGTQVGTIKGKVAYMAPEQVISPHSIGRQTDIFQLGLVLWEGIIGRRMWEGLSECDILLKLAHNAPWDMSAPPGTDPDLVRIGQRAIAIAPQERYATAEDFAAELEAYMVTRNIRARAKDVGAYVAQLFTRQRQELRNSIQHRIRNLEVAPGSDRPVSDRALPAFYTFHASGLSESKQLPIDAVFPGTETQSRAPTGSAGLAKPFWRRFLWLAIAGAAALMGVGTVVGARLLLRNNNATAASPSAALLSADQSVELSVSATPAQARLFLDNRPLPSNPYKGQLSKDNANHLVRAEAVGYRTATLNVRLDRNTENMIVLTPEAPGAEAPAVSIASLPPIARTTRGRALIAAPRAAAGAATTSSSANSPNTAARAEPPAAPAAPATPAIKLDNSDPWR